MSSVVLDASAVLALVHGEPGQDAVAAALAASACMSAVNLSEVVAKFCEEGVPEEKIHDMLDPLGIAIVEYDANLAYRAGLLRRATRTAGLSLGDRACLALALHRNLPVLTADRAWATLSIGASITVLR